MPMILANETTGVLASVVTAEMVGGVFDELTSLLPVMLPVMVSFIGLRKGLGFVVSALHSA